MGFRKTVNFREGGVIHTHTHTHTHKLMFKISDNESRYYLLF